MGLKAGGPFTSNCGEKQMENWVEMKRKLSIYRKKNVSLSVSLSLSLSLSAHIAELARIVAQRPE